MAIKSSRGPARGVERVGQALSALSGDTSLGMAMAAESGGVAAQNLLSRPLPVYGADLESLRALAGREHGLEHLQRTGWRYLVLDDSDLQAADLVGRRKQPTLHFGDDLAARIGEAGKLAEQTADERLDYEPRILDLGMLGASLLWLKSKNPKADLFFTLDAAPYQVDRERLLRRLAVEAERKLAAFEEDRADDSGESEAGG